MDQSVNRRRGKRAGDNPQLAQVVEAEASQCSDVLSEG